MKDVDILVTYLNSSDAHWQELYNKYREEEIEKGIQDKNYSQAFGPERSRNWGDAIKYWFRGVEKNVPWVRYIHFVCMDENHVPEWLDKSNPKLKIHYHRDFIPEQYLPTFSALTIYTFEHRIEDLSDCFIHMDDDFYFMNPTPKEYFVKDDKPVMQNSFLNNLWFKRGGDPWHPIMNSTFEAMKKAIGKDFRLLDSPHLPFLRVKSDEKEIVDNNTFIIESNTYSRFRSPRSVLIPWLSINYTLANRECVLNNNYTNSSYLTLKSQANFERASHWQMVCMNDTEQVDNYEITCKRMNEFLNKMLPNKSSFEV